MRLFLFVCIVGLFAAPLCADSIYIFGSYLSPNGRSDTFEQNRRETTFETDDLNDFAFSAGYDHFIGEYVTLGGSITYYKEDAVGRDRAFLALNGSPVVRDFRLKMLPVELNARVLPVGRDVPVFYSLEEEPDFTFGSMKKLAIS